MFPSTSNIPATGLPPAGVTVKVVVVTDDGAIGSEDTAPISASLATRVSPLAGVVADTVGGVLSALVGSPPPQELRPKAIASASTPGRRARRSIGCMGLRRQESGNSCVEAGRE